RRGAGALGGAALDPDRRTRRGSTRGDQQPARPAGAALLGDTGNGEEMTNDVATVEDRQVLEVITGMLRGILDEYAVDEVEITPASTFHEDLELESIDLVALAGRLQEHYGERVNLAEFLADKDLEEVIALTVGQLVRFVPGCRCAGSSPMASGSIISGCRR